jgi:hypothetical protein
VRVRAGEGNPVITIDIANAESGETFRETLTRSSEPGWQKAELDLPPGTWRITASAPGASSVTDLAVVATA